MVGLTQFLFATTNLSDWNNPSCGMVSPSKCVERLVALFDRKSD